MRMKAAVFYGPGDVRIEDKPVRKIGSDEVLIKVRACGVCGTDVHIFEGAAGSAKVSPPVVLGHEFSGEIVEIGDAVCRLRVGDRVTIDPNISCGNCYYCQRGQVHLCENLRAIGVTQDGGFAELAIVSEKQAFQLPDNVSFTAGAMVEPIACCLHGIDLAEIKPADSVLIVGGGTIGMIMLQLARSVGASRIFLSEPEEKKRALAEKLGADEAIDPNKISVPERIREKTGHGVDVAIECVGSAATANDAIASCGRGGRVMLFGLAPPECEISVRPFEIFRRELTIRSSFVNPFTHARAIDLLAGGRVKTETFMSRSLPLEKLASVLAKAELRRGGKILICPD
ncbi:MAG: zinc-dependent alcohol dehydrogenase family protein [Calditrichaeota bacterium]|nr:zinc-dependent alcohol dehydrogenase family protein [Calditrichota bacterium]